MFNKQAISRWPVSKVKEANGVKKRGAEFADPGSKKLSSVVREEQGTEG